MYVYMYVCVYIYIYNIYIYIYMCVCVCVMTRWRMVSRGVDNEVRMTKKDDVEPTYHNCIWDKMTSIQSLSTLIGVVVRTRKPN
jgi:hypothetical protein